MLLENERYYGLIMVALVTLVTRCSWNTNVNYGLGMDAMERSVDESELSLLARVSGGGKKPFNKC